MDPRASKLVKLGVDAEDAVALVTAGFDKPSLIRKAEVKDLEAVPGIGKSKREELKAKFGSKA